MGALFEEMQSYRRPTPAWLQPEETQAWLPEELQCCGSEFVHEVRWHFLGQGCWFAAAWQFAF